MPYMFYTEEMLLKKASAKESNDLLQFMNPFANEVWFATLGTLVVVSIAVFVLNYFSPYGYKNENGKGTSEEFTFFNSVWFSLACMLQQGGDNTPKSLSGTGNSFVSFSPNYESKVGKYFLAAKMEVREFSFRVRICIFQQKRGPSHHCTCKQDL